MLGLPRYVLPLRINSEHLDVPFYGLHKVLLFFAFLLVSTILLLLFQFYIFICSSC
jgi:hypothetical protein